MLNNACCCCDKNNLGVTMEFRCKYCEYTAGAVSALKTHMAKFHEHRLAKEGESKLDNVPVKEYPGRPKVWAGGFGFQDCTICHGAGAVYCKNGQSPEWRGRAYYCPGCFPELDAKTPIFVQSRQGIKGGER